jgi:1,2-dihydroxy-3-keto-5-methylthiopentene dioxygenase
MHWLTAIPIIGCVGCVLKAQEAPKEDKGTWMHRHKSLGLLSGMIVAPRLAYRLVSRSSYSIESLPGSSKIEHMLANVSHAGLYGFMLIMPASGIAMGYYGGKGLPFFGVTLPGVVKTDENKKSTGEIAKQVRTVFVGSCWKMPAGFGWRYIIIYLLYCMMLF